MQLLLDQPSPLLPEEIKIVTYSECTLNIIKNDRLHGHSLYPTTS
jgi:hypothetical protein